MASTTTSTQAFIRCEGSNQPLGEPAEIRWDFAPFGFKSRTPIYTCPAGCGYRATLGIAPKVFTLHYRTA